MYVMQFSTSEAYLDAKDRLSFGQVVDKVFWGLIVLIAMWAGTQLKELTASVQNLNSTMIQLSSRVETARSDLDRIFFINEKQDDRLRAIELKLEIKAAHNRK